MTDALLASAFDADTKEIWLVLLTISHADIDPPIRVVNNTESITSRGNEFVGFPFDITLPDSKQDAPPRARLTIDNVSREISQAIRLVSTAPAFLIEVVRAGDPDTVEVSWPFFKMLSVDWDVDSVSGDLSIEDFMTEPFPAGIFGPISFPGLL